MKKLLLVAVALMVVSAVSFGQLQAGKMAFTTSIAPAGAIGGSYALSENMRLNAGLNFSSSSTSGTSSTNFGLGASLWMYNPVMENVSLFYGAGFNFGSTSIAGTSSSAFGIDVLGGAEYWFSSRFAWGGGVSAGFSSSGPSGATTSTFGTLGTFTTLSWWFN
ncbi:MAG: hypothetical protein WCT99_00020 [Bacteroidota bacterium]|jgi:hypothetical protein